MIDQSINKLLNPRIAEALSYGNPGEKITIRLNRGKLVKANAANVINSTKVLAAKTEDGNWYVWSQTSPRKISQQTIDFYQSKIIPEVIESVGIFLVLVSDSLDKVLFRGGDIARQQLVDRSNSGIRIIGVTKTGLGVNNYISIWEETESNNLVIFNNRISTLIPIQNVFDSLFTKNNFNWYGGSYYGVANPQRSFIDNPQDLPENITETGDNDVLAGPGITQVINPIPFTNTSINFTRVVSQNGSGYFSEETRSSNGNASGSPGGDSYSGIKTTSINRIINTFADTKTKLLDTEFVGNFTSNLIETSSVTEEFNSSGALDNAAELPAEISLMKLSFSGVNQTIISNETVAIPISPGFTKIFTESSFTESNSTPRIIEANHNPPFNNIFGFETLSAPITRVDDISSSFTNNFFREIPVPIIVASDNSSALYYYRRERKNVTTNTNTTLNNPSGFITTLRESLSLDFAIQTDSNRETIIENYSDFIPSSILEHRFFSTNNDVLINSENSFFMKLDNSFNMASIPAEGDSITFNINSFYVSYYDNNSQPIVSYATDYSVMRIFDQSSNNRNLVRETININNTREYGFLDNLEGNSVYLVYPSDSLESSVTICEATITNIVFSDINNNENNGFTRRRNFQEVTFTINSVVNAPYIFYASFKDSTQVYAVSKVNIWAAIFETIKNANLEGVNFARVEDDFFLYFFPKEAIIEEINQEFQSAVDIYKFIDGNWIWQGNMQGNRLPFTGDLNNFASRVSVFL